MHLLPPLVEDGLDVADAGNLAPQLDFLPSYQLDGPDSELGDATLLEPTRLTGLRFHGSFEFDWAPLPLA